MAQRWHGDTAQRWPLLEVAPKATLLAGARALPRDSLQGAKAKSKEQSPRCKEEKREREI